MQVKMFTIGRGLASEKEKWNIGQEFNYYNSTGDTLNVCINW